MKLEINNLYYYTVLCQNVIRDTNRVLIWSVLPLKRTRVLGPNTVFSNKVGTSVKLCKLPDPTLSLRSSTQNYMYMHGR